MPLLSSPQSTSHLHAEPAARRPSRSTGVQTAAKVIGGSLLLAIAAHVAVPFWPVPLTLQTFAVLGLGAAFGPAVGAAAVLAWICQGLAGLPVFAAGAGPAVLLGPTGGYILGFVPAAMLAGLAARRGWLGTPVKSALSFLAADAVLFAVGVAWLAVLVGPERAVAGGLVPFVLGEVLKVSLLTAGAQVLTRRRA